MIYSFVNKNVFCVGDIHGNFKQLVYEITAKEFKNSIIIVAGDCGIGFESKTYYKDLFHKLNKKLKVNDNIVLFVRGNHDDPYFFNEEPIDLTNIKSIQDYSIINIDLFAGEEYNILCIGGAISVDRGNRKLFDFKTNNSKYTKRKRYTYWAGEGFILDEFKIKDINNKINCIITHTNPFFDNGIISGFVKQMAEVNKDTDLIRDISLEHNKLKHMYFQLLELGHPISKWCHGHFHKSITYKLHLNDNEVLIYSLNNIESTHKYDFVELVRGY